MRFARIELRNWKNFSRAEVDLAPRTFIVGPNASGKSNFLEAFKFLRDLATPGGGLAQALRVRGGMKGVRSVYARKNPLVQLRVEVTDRDADNWSYDLAFNVRDKSGAVPVLSHEIVRRETKDGRKGTVLNRPDNADKLDPERLTQTAIEQISANKDFRELADFFRSVLYLHLVPQLVREGHDRPSGIIGDDSLGRDILDRIRGTTKRARETRLKRIQQVLEIAVPQFQSLELIEDEKGKPHLQVRFTHWRPLGAFQDESQFSDGTLRLIGLLWSLQEGTGALLLEEPELSLHAGLLTKLAPFIHRAQKSANNRQVILSTHSEHLLRDKGIQADEVLFVEPGEEGSAILEAAKIPDVRDLMTKAGLTASEAVLPRTRVKQLHLFDKITA